MLAEHPHRAIELPLGPLSDADASRLLAALVSEPLTEEAQAEIIVRAEGNPLYIEQLLRVIVESGSLGTAPGLDLSPSTTRAVPVALESLLVSRIDALPRSARQLAQAAAVVGRSFSYSLLSRVIRASMAI